MNICTFFLSRIIYEKSSYICIPTVGMFNLLTMTEKLSRDIRVNTIVTASVEEFLENGYAATSMDAIAKRAGISKGGLYHHFRNKDQILLYANRVFSAPVENMMLELDSASDKVSGLEIYIRDYIRYWNEHRRELQFFFLSMNKAFSDPMMLDSFKDYFHQECAFFKNIYLTGRQRGQFEFSDADTIVVPLISALDGSLAYLLIDEKLTADTLTDYFCKQFVHPYIPSK